MEFINRLVHLKVCSSQHMEGSERIPKTLQTPTWYILILLPFMFTTLAIAIIPHIFPSLYTFLFHKHNYIWCFFGFTVQTLIKGFHTND
jgi:hypothetical protein